MTRIFTLFLALGLLAGCAALPARVAHTPLERDYWHGYSDWGRGFAVQAPGRFAIRPAGDGAQARLAPRSYSVERGTLRFSIVAYPQGGAELPAAMADDAFDLVAWDAVDSEWPAFQRHVYLDGRLYRQRMVFAHGMTFELTVSGPADVFPDAAARRFLDSFAVLVRT